MRITDIREIALPLRGNIENALVSFAEHTISLVAVCTDQMRDGRAVVGLAFNSIGRFTQGGLLRERFVPRLRAAPPDSLLDASGTRFDAAVAALELAFGDTNATLAEEPAWRTIARHFGRTPHGGHLINLHVVTGIDLGGCEAYPGVFQPFGGYAPTCTLRDGRIWPLDAPGCGLEEKPELAAHIRALQDAGRSTA